MTRSRHLLLAWGLLIALLAIEFGASFLALDRTARLFFAAGLLWLCILLGLGSLDPMTRINYYVLTTNLK